MLQAKECAPIPCYFVVFTSDSHLSLSKSLGARYCKWHVTYCWKDLDEGYNFILDFASIRGLHKQLRASKVERIPILGILGLLIWES